MKILGVLTPELPAISMHALMFYSPPYCTLRSLVYSTAVNYCSRMLRVCRRPRIRFVIDIYTIQYIGFVYICSSYIVHLGHCAFCVCTSICLLVGACSGCIVHFKASCNLDNTTIQVA